MFRIDCYRRRHCWLIWHFVAEERERERINSSTFTRWHTLSEVCSCRCFACIGQQVSQFSFWFAALFSSGRARFFFFFFLISSHLTHFVLALRHVTSLAFCGSSRRRLYKFNFDEIPIGCDSGRRFLLIYFWIFPLNSRSGRVDFHCLQNSPKLKSERVQQ